MRRVNALPWFARALQEEGSTGLHTYHYKVVDSADAMKKDDWHRVVAVPAPCCPLLRPFLSLPPAVPPALLLAPVLAAPAHPFLTPLSSPPLSSFAPDRSGNRREAGVWQRT